MITVRAKLALTVVAAGVLTALLVIGTVLVAFERFERETTYQRAVAFLMRVSTSYDNLLDEHARRPAELHALLRNLVLYEPEMQLYLLDARGAVLSSTIEVPLPADFRVPLEQHIALGEIA